MADLEALARQYGGTVEQNQPDLDELAKRYGGTVEAVSVQSKAMPGFVSRAKESSGLSGVEQVSDAIQLAMRSQNPPKALLESLGRGAKNLLGSVAETRSAKGGNPIGGFIEMAAEPVINVGKDMLGGNLAGAAGGALGLLVPAGPAAVKAVRKPVVNAAVKGAAATAKSQVRPVLESIDLTKPGKDLFVLADSINKIYKGGKQGVADFRKQARDAKATGFDPGRSGAADLPRERYSGKSKPEPAKDFDAGTPTTADFPRERYGPDSPKSQVTEKFDAGTSSSADMPRESYRPKHPKPPASERFDPGSSASGDMPKERYGTTPKPTTAVTTGPPKALLDDLAKGQTGQSFDKLSPARQKVVRALAEKVAEPKPIPAKAEGIMGRLDAKGIADMQELAAELNPDQTPSPKPVQYEAGARAKKVWNVSDKLMAEGWTSETFPDIPPDQLLGLINELNGEILKEWKIGGGKGKKPNLHHAPSMETLRQIQQEMAETEARKVNE